MDLKGSDVILGMKWMQSYREVWFNWVHKAVKFKQSGKWLKLYSDPSLMRTMLIFQNLCKTTDASDDAYLVCSNDAAMDEQISSHTKPHSEIQCLLERFLDIFHMPTKLPPTRSIEHHIVLKEWEGSVNVWPYCYPQHQKNEIEKLVSEMLQ